MHISAPCPRKECRGVFADVTEESLPIESEFMHFRDLATLGGNTVNSLL